MSYRLPSERTLTRIMAFTDETKEDFARLAYDIQAAAWVQHEHLIGEDRFRYELRERWEAMNGARRAALRKPVPWLRELYAMALHRSI
jgi:hypothetical protein